jgi:hypothetical protein
MALALTLSPDDGQPVAPRDYAFSGTFEHKQEFKMELSGASTTAVGFGTIPASGAKVLWLEYLLNTTGLPVLNVRFNGGSEDIELSPGGILVKSSPSPAAGFTSLSLIHTAGGTVRGTLLA